MSNNQEMLINIEQDIKTEADFMSRNFINKEVRNRAYINVLGAELFTKYLSTEGIDVKDLHNIHSISKVLEMLDIADIILPDIHIDVRTVFDKTRIFIPKSHFELGITPDIYAVLYLDKDFGHCEFIGYFTPDMIDKSKENSEYYFIEQDKLNQPSNLIKYITNFSGRITDNISDAEFYRGRELSVTLSDHNLSIAETRELLQMLIQSSTLRESIIEFDNFETLAYNTVKEMTFEENSYEELFEEDSNDFDGNTEEESEQPESENEEAFTGESFTDEPEEPVAEDFFNPDEFETLEEDSSALDESFFDELTEAVEESEQESLPAEEIGEEQENIIPEPDTNTEIEEPALNPVDETVSVVEDVLPEPPITETVQMPESLPLEEPSVDNILDRVIDSIGTGTEELKIDNLDLNPNIDLTLDENLTIGESEGINLGEAVQETLETANDIAKTAEKAVEAIETTTTTAEETIAENAIKLAGIAGDALEDILDLNADNQQKNLDKIDYTKIETNAEEIPDDIAAILPDAKITTETDAAFDTPTDLSELNVVENPLNKEEVIEHETIDLHAMETVESTDIMDVNEEVINLDNINVNSPTKPVDNLNEIISNTTEEEGMDLPDLSVFSIEPEENFNQISDELPQEFSHDDITEPEPDNTEELFNELTAEDFPAEDITDELTPDDLNDLTEDETQAPQEDIPAYEEASFFDDEELDNIEPEISENIDESELDEEFSVDLNTEMESDETLTDDNPIQDFEEGIIESPSTETRLVIENSTIISDKNFTVGEIPIDINITPGTGRMPEGHEPLESLYNEESQIPNSGMIQTPGHMGTHNSKGGAKTGLGIIGGLVVLAAVCIIGFSAAKIFKAPTEEALQPTTDEDLAANTLNTTTTEESLNVNQDNVVKMDNNTNVLADVKPSTPSKAATAAQNTAPAKKAMPETAFLEVKKLTWEVPDYISYSPQFKQYFQSAGKSLKLSLTSDLLLATDFAYSNEIKVTVTFNKDGSFKAAQILKSSGSKQIDKIVLQTVNQTLNVLKAPPSVRNDESTTAILKIYL